MTFESDEIKEYKFIKFKLLKNNLNFKFVRFLSF